MKRGKFIVVDGLDGIGKGFFLQVLAEEAQRDGKRVLDVTIFWKEHNRHPLLSEIIGKYDVVLTAEPTFCGIGKYIREELVAKNNRSYSQQVIAEAYAVDRRILYEILVLPLLEKGIDVYQSRSLTTSVVYQQQSALNQGDQFSPLDILSIPGNVFCYNHPMDHLIIPTIQNVAEVMERLQQRGKQDNCQFENLPFQLQVKKHYDSEEFQQLFRVKGVTITYLDAGQTLDFSRKQAQEFHQKYLKN